jgi:hypothetical protein
VLTDVKDVDGNSIAGGNIVQVLLQTWHKLITVFQSKMKNVGFYFIFHKVLCSFRKLIVNKHSDYRTVYPLVLHKKGDC